MPAAPRSLASRNRPIETRPSSTGDDQMGASRGTLAWAMACAAMLFLLHPSMPRAAGLNDTGQAEGDGGSGTLIGCDSPLGRLQDASYGRDAAAGVLPRIGDGAGGFDFTKVSETGADLPASAPHAAEAWVCTRD